MGLKTDGKLSVLLYNFNMQSINEVKIKKITTEDKEWRTSFTTFYSDCEIKKIAPLQAHAYFAAYAGSELAGHSVIYFENKRWIMDGLRVKPEFRQRGIAKSLTEARIRHAVENGAKEVWYSCDDGNLVTICCHLGFGFQKVCPDNHRCSPATTHWYRLSLNSITTKTLSSLKPTRLRKKSAPHIR